MVKTRAPERPGRTQSERSEATTTALVEAGRRLFARDGYEGANLDEVARTAGVTKGALYHHFANKRDLFRAVFEAEERALARTCAAAYTREADPWKGFYEGCRAFLDACLDPGMQRITLVDAPAVLGWDAVREVEERYSMSLVRNGIQIAIDAGIIAKRRVDPLATILNGALCEAAMMVARSEDPRSATKHVLGEIKALLELLRVDRG